MTKEEFESVWERAYKAGYDAALCKRPIKVEHELGKDWGKRINENEWDYPIMNKMELNNYES